jgi:hypothetical protein
MCSYFVQIAPEKHTVCVLHGRGVLNIQLEGVAKYRVIHKSLRDFRPLRYSSRDGHAEGEHVNRGRDNPSLSYLTGARYVHPW